MKLLSVFLLFLSSLTAAFSGRDYIYIKEKEIDNIKYPEGKVEFYANDKLVETYNVEDIQETSGLFLGSNNLKQVPVKLFKLLPKLTRVALRDNMIETLHENDFAGLSLKFLSLEKNPIKYYQKNAFSKVKDLRGLVVGDKDTVYDKNFLAGIPFLQSLTVVGSVASLTSDHFKRTPSLSDLHLNNNNLREIPDYLFKHLNKVMYFGFTENFLQNVSQSSFKAFPDLKLLSLNSNNITGLYKNSIPRSTDSLWIFENTIRYIEPSAFEGSELTFLDISQNNLTAIPEDVTSAKHLQQLIMSENFIHALQPEVIKKLSQLQVLALDGNFITKIPNKVFTSSSQLKELNLRNNKINEVEKDAFKGLKSIDIISLENNRIKYFSNLVFAYPYLQQCDIGIDENPAASSEQCAKQTGVKAYMKNITSVTTACVF